MSAYKNEKKAEEMLKGKDGLEYFIPKHYAVRVYHGVNQSLYQSSRISSSCMLPENRSRISKKKYNFLTIHDVGEKHGTEIYRGAG